MHLPTQTASLASIEAYHALAQEAAQAVHHEFQAVEELYIKLLERYRAQSNARNGGKDDAGDLMGGWRGDEEEGAVEETVTLGLSGMEFAVEEPSVEGEYIQVIIDCASLKFILDPGKRGYQSGTQLIDDLSELIDRHLSDAARVETVLPDRVQDMISAPSQDWLDETPPTSPNPVTPVTPPLRRIPKRFTLLIDPPKMIDKNYPTRKEKARTFVAGLYDAANVEMVHIGLGRKSVEDLITELTAHHLLISQCSHLFLAVGITSNNSHHVLNLSQPTLRSLSAHTHAAKLCIMRSGGPFDARWGLDCVAIDKYLSVQVQIPGAAGSGTGNGAGAGTGMGSRYVMASASTGAGKDSEPQRERRSFAPSPPGVSARGLPGSESDKTAVTVDTLFGGSEADVRSVVVDEMTTSAKVIPTFEPSAIRKTYGKPLCTKYHLNHGVCHCPLPRTASLHEEVILEPAASKALAVWASGRACPEGTGCPDAFAGKCCFWIHEAGAGTTGGIEGAVGTGREADEWISVDKKGKPIVTKNLQPPKSWQPSSTCNTHGKLVRADFQPLTTTLRLFERERNEHKHERGLIGTELKRAYGHDLYRRLGLSGFREYTALAEKAGLIKMGYFGESAGWISLP